MKINVIGLGAGGHAKVIIETLRESDMYEVKVLLDPNPQLHGLRVLGVPVLGGDDRIEELMAQGLQHFFIGVGSVGDSSIRKRVYNNALRCGLRPVGVVHPRAIVSTSASIGPGGCVLAGAIINSSTTVGANTLINTGAILEHDCALVDHVHVAPGACVAGGVNIGEGSHVGAGAVILQGLKVGRGVIIGAGAVVVKDVPDNVTVAGVPARVTRQA